MTDEDLTQHAALVNKLHDGTLCGDEARTLFRLSSKMPKIIDTSALQRSIFHHFEAVNVDLAEAA